LGYGDCKKLRNWVPGLVAATVLKETDSKSLAKIDINLLQKTNPCESQNFEAACGKDTFPGQLIE